MKAERRWAQPMLPKPHDLFGDGVSPRLPDRLAFSAPGGHIRSMPLPDLTQRDAEKVALAYRHAY
jgi:hypothetical protein